ncbi:MAG: Rid family detoxifying hydrolase [Verrucomicrobiae bacterium]|nr:Rid family detoxifying hydrolase [Verrucomicrobiae bacterium]
MKKTVVNTDVVPRAIGPYSQAVWVGKFGSGDLLFCSGQIAPEAGDTAAQTKRVLENIRALLASQGLTMECVVKTTVFLVDMNDFAAMNEVYATFFPTDPPARSTVQVARLPKDARVEIEVVACRL